MCRALEQGACGGRERHGGEDAPSRRGRVAAIGGSPKPREAERHRQTRLESLRDGADEKVVHRVVPLPAKDKNAVMFAGARRTPWIPCDVALKGRSRPLWQTKVCRADDKILPSGRLLQSCEARLTRGAGRCLINIPSNPDDA